MTPHDNKGFIPDTKEQGKKAHKATSVDMDKIPIVVIGDKELQVKPSPQEEGLPSQDMQDQQPLLLDPAEIKPKMPVQIIPKSPPPTPEGYTVAEHYQL